MDIRVNIYVCVDIKTCIFNTISMPVQQLLAEKNPSTHCYEEKVISKLILDRNINICRL